MSLSGRRLCYVGLHGVLALSLFFVVTRGTKVIADGNGGWMSLPVTSSMRSLATSSHGSAQGSGRRQATKPEGAHPRAST